MVKSDLQIFRTRNPPILYQEQLVELLATEGISLSPSELFSRLKELPKTERLLLAVEGDQLVGYAHMRIVHDLIRGAIVEIVSILVQKRRRRQGIGRRLIAAAESWARQAEHSHLLLRSDVTRTAGHAFFTALGYQQETTQLEFIRSLHS